MDIKTLVLVIVFVLTVTGVSAKELEVTATAYCFATETATGCKPHEGMIAVSRDMLKSGWNYGDVVEIEGLGHFVIKDTMHKSKKRSIDVYVKDKRKARDFGKKTTKIKKSKEAESKTASMLNAWNDAGAKGRQSKSTGGNRKVRGNIR